MNKDFNIFRIRFADVRSSEMKEDKRKKYVTFGKKNEFPDYLLDMSKESAKHNAIIRGKVDFIMGKGIAVVDDESDPNTGEPKTYKFVNAANDEGESLDDVTRRVVHDVETFGGAYVELIFDKAGKLKYMNHLDFTKIRASKKLDSFFYAPDGFTEKRADGEYSEINKIETREIPAYSKGAKQASAIVFLREYTPGMDVYPLPGYVGALRYIATDIAISEYHLAGITNGMFSSKLVAFNNGVPEDGDKAEIESLWNKKFGGPKNAGRVMISFSKSKDNAPEIHDLSGTELDKHFDVLNKTVEQEIYSGHRVTSPMLFGIKTAGQLGGRKELREAFELFNATYIEGKRSMIERFLNEILPLAGVPKVEIQRTEPIGHEFDAATIADNMTEDEIRERIGLLPRDESGVTKGISKIVRKLSALPALVANKVLDNLTPNEIRAIVGAQALPGGDDIQGQTDPASVPVTPAPAPNPGQTFDDDLDDDADALIFGEFGSNREDFDIYESRRILYEDQIQAANGYFAQVKDLKGNKLAVLELLKNDPKADAAAIAQALDITEGRAAAILEDLAKAKLLTITEAGEGEEKIVTRKPNADAADIINKGGDGTTAIKVLYSYEGPKDSKNRPFCKKILELDRLYSRQEIESISERVGYSVWHRRGGWYKPKGASEARPYCRHSWFANVVIDKKK